MTIYWLAMAEILYTRVMKALTSEVTPAMDKPAFRDLSQELKAQWVCIAKESKSFQEKRA